jgi:hypothetical protein
MCYRGSVERRGEGTGQRGQQEAAAVHAGMVGRAAGQVKQLKTLISSPVGFRVAPEARAGRAR